MQAARLAAASLSISAPSAPSPAAGNLATDMDIHIKVPDSGGDEQAARVLNVLIACCTISLVTLPLLMPLMSTSFCKWDAQESIRKFQEFFGSVLVKIVSFWHEAGRKLNIGIYSQ